MQKYSKLLLPFILSVVMFGGCIPKQQQTTEEFTLTILHTNDTHSHLAGINKYGNACFDDTDCTGGFTRIAQAINDEKAQNPAVIALDAGDQFQGTLFYSVKKEEIFSDIDPLMPYDAVTLGNHEFDEGCLIAEKFIAMQKYPVLAANLKPEKGCPLLKADYEPYIVKEVQGKKIGIIGIANDEVMTAACKHTKFSPVEETVQHYADLLTKQGIDHIVLITHIGLHNDVKLAENLRNVDVIVGGHSHSYLAENSEAGPYPIVTKDKDNNPILIVTAKRATQYLGKLAVTFDEQGVAKAWAGNPLELTKDFPRDEKIQPLVTELAKELDSFRNDIVGINEAKFDDGMDACRSKDCLGAMLTADAILAYGKTYGADIAIVNGGSMRAAYPQGNISRGDLMTIYPFANTIVLRELTGEQIWEALEHGLTKEGGLPSPTLVHASGLLYTADLDKPKGQMVSDIAVLDEKGNYVPLDLKKNYIVALSSFLAGGGDGFEMFTQGKALESVEPIDVDLIVDYIKANSPIQMPNHPRITLK